MTTRASSVVDPRAVGAMAEPTTHHWTSKDSLVYALGVGAGTEDLAFTTENSEGVEQRAIPTQAAVLGGSMGRVLRMAGQIKLTSLIHGDQAIEWHRELPVEGTLVATTSLAGISDKGRHALLVIQTEAVDAAGEPLFTSRSGLIIRGAGGFGETVGVAGITSPALPDREPDRAVTYQTSQDQALIYRLSGDRNPLHSDPAFAAAGGFPRPILHGLCTYGFTCRGLLDSVLDGDPRRLRSMYGRFSSPVLPGERLKVEVWRSDAGSAVFRTVVADDGRVVIDQGVVTFTA